MREAAAVRHGSWQLAVRAQTDGGLLKSVGGQRSQDSALLQYKDIIFFLAHL